MSIYRVLQTPNKNQEMINSIISDDDSLLIKEKFSWFAFLLPPIWAIANNLWVELILFIAAVIFLSLLNPIIGSEASFWLYILGSFWIGVEACSILTRSKKRKGFVAMGDLLAQNDEEAFASWVNSSLDFTNKKHEEILQENPK